jgi:hypothetical protein
MNSKSTISNLINTIDEIDETLNIYLPKHVDMLNMDTPCLLVTSDTELDEMIIDNECFNYVLGVYSIKDVFENLKQQLNDPTDEQRLEAINFYINNDAYVKLV